MSMAEQVRKMQDINDMLLRALEMLSKLEGKSIEQVYDEMS